MVIALAYMIPVVSADREVIQDVITYGAPACKDYGMYVKEDMDTNGVLDTLVVFQTINGYASPDMWGYFFTVPSAAPRPYCAYQPPDRGRYVVYFVDMLAPGFSDTNPATWTTFKSFPGVEITGFHNQDQWDYTLGNPYLGINAYRGRNQQDPISGVHTPPDIPNGLESWSFDDSGGSGIKELFISTDYVDNALTQFIIKTSSPGTLSVTSPNGGETWQQDSFHWITWTSSGTVGTEVKIELLKGSSVEQTLSTGTANDGSFSWTVSSTLETDDDYRIRITSTSNAAILDTSNSYFTISAAPPSPTIIVTSPNGGEGYAVDNGYGIQWSYTGSSDQLVRIELRKGGVLNTVLTPSTSIGADGLGYYYWEVSPIQPTGDDYSIKISNTVDPAVNDTSDAPFSVNPYSGVLLKIPDGGETWQQGTTHTIHWDHYSSWHATTAELYLLKNGQVVSTINKTVPIGSNHHGSYDWTVPQSAVPGTDYKIRIYTIPGGDSDDSNATFTITSASVTLPTASFTVNTTTGTAPLGVLFTDSSSGSGITAWNWSFGDGTWENRTSSTNPVHSYAAGTWHPRLTVTNSSGSNTSLITPARTITVTAAPSAGSAKIGIFRPSSGIWSLDSNGNFAWEGSDVSLSWGLPNDVPVIGDWNGDGKEGIGIFRPSSGIWSLDSNENLVWEPSDVSLSWGLPNDVPVIGDWNGDSRESIGIFRPSSGIWSLDSNENFAWAPSDTSLSWGLPNDKPVVGNY